MSSAYHCWARAGKERSGDGPNKAAQDGVAQSVTKNMYGKVAAALQTDGSVVASGKIVYLYSIDILMYTIVYVCFRL